MNIRSCNSIGGIALAPTSPLYSKSLELAQRRSLASSHAVFCNQSCNVHAQVTEGCKEKKAVDGLVEASSEQKGGQDEEDAEEREYGSDSLCYHHCIDLAGGRLHDHDGRMLAGSRNAGVRSG